MAILMSRLKAPTPQWFRYIRNSGFILTACGMAIMAYASFFPALVVTLGAYSIVAGAIAAAIASTAKQGE